MQSNRIRQNLIAVQNIESSTAYILMAWDGTEIQVIEVTDIETEAELEQFVLKAAKEGNDFLRRILKHRLEMNGGENAY